MKTIIIPGYSSSIGDHWQAWLHDELKNSSMVLQDDWVYPQKKVWVQRLREYLLAHNQEDIVLVAHSLGCVTLASLFDETFYAPHIKGALLVAPADSEQDDFPEDIQGFEKMPTASLPFSTILIGSRNDHYMKFERAKFFANCWGSAFVDYGNVGHINTASGFGPWPDIINFQRHLIA